MIDSKYKLYIWLETFGGDPISFSDNSLNDLIAFYCGSNTTINNDNALYVLSSLIGEINGRGLYYTDTHRLHWHPPKDILNMSINMNN